MYKILTVVGARPQFIKAAAVSHTLSSSFSGRIEEDILHTGQHYDDQLSGSFFRELDIPTPKYNLGVGSGTHGLQTAAILERTERVLLDNKYDGLLVYGDTNSTLAAALAAAKLLVPIFHVEAGLRSFNRTMPEEINRILTDHVSSLLFAPTERATKNLLSEGIDQEKICLCGDVMLDNLLSYSASLPAPTLSSPLILATIHRDFNTDSPSRLSQILHALSLIGQRFGSKVLLPLHPRTRLRLSTFGIVPDETNILLSPPLSYLQTLAALRAARLVLTDSGGLQKEAFFSGTPCVILRPETEWGEILESGAAILADADERRILLAAEQLWDVHPCPPSQFGDGNAAAHILSRILHFLDEANPSTRR